MKNWLSVIFAVLSIGCAGLLRNSMNSNKVTTLGSLHSKMLTNKGYSLRHFVGAIQAFKPDVILTEVRAELPGPIEGSIDGGIEQSIVYAIAENMGATVVPVDWFDDSLISEMTSEEQRLTPEAKAEIEPIWKSYVDDFASRTIVDLNSSSVQDKVRSIYRTFEKYGMRASRKRNDRIVENIARALKPLSGKRVLIVFGLDHKFFIDEHVRALSGQEVVEVPDWLTPETLVDISVSNSSKEKALRNVLGAKRVLQERLRAGHYAPDMQGRLMTKLETFEQWEKGVSDL